jgi:hypothetical protein
MNAPAVLLRRAAEGGEAITVAKAPFIILAHGLLTIAPEMRGSFWISSPAGDIGPAEVEAVLRDWLHPASAA